MRVGPAALLGLALAPAIALFTLPTHAWGGQLSVQVEEDLIQETVRSLAAVVDQEYFDPHAAERVKDALLVRLADGRYLRARTVESLASMLTDDLYELTSDKHLSVSAVRPPDPDPSSAQTSDDSREQRGRRSNFGIEQVRILGGNVGYLDITFFYRPDEASDTIAAAMELLRNSDALIVDMRRNAGGSPDTVALFASHFFDSPGVPLFEIVHRYGPTDAYSTAEPAIPNRDGVRPLYVLTSARTFSAGEGFAFLVKEQRRGEVLGEKTPGAANPGRPYPVNSRFEVTVPNGRVRMAVSGGNWEGVGVTPDIEVPATDALRVAHGRALRSLLDATPNGSWADALRKELETLEADGKE